MSVTFVSTVSGFVLGTYPCGAANGCLALLHTPDSGHTWTAVRPPPTQTSPGYTSGVHRVRFADERNGWVFGPELWVTHDGGAHWRRPPLPGAAAAGEVESLEIGAGLVHAVVLDDGGVHILSSAVAADAWTASTTTIPVGAGPVPQAQLAVQGPAGWAIEVDRTVVGGARLSGARWVSWQPPCESAGGFAALAAATASDVDAVCDEGVWTGSSESVHAYLSTDGGTTFRRVAPALEIADATAIGSSPSGAVVVGGSGHTGTGVLLASFDAGSTWATVYQGGDGVAADELGFETANQGVAIATGAAAQLLMTFDGGHHWSPVTFG